MTREKLFFKILTSLIFIASAIIIYTFILELSFKFFLIVFAFNLVFTYFYNLIFHNPTMNFTKALSRNQVTSLFFIDHYPREFITCRDDECISGPLAAEFYGPFWFKQNGRQIKFYSRDENDYLVKLYLIIGDDLERLTRAKFNQVRIDSDPFEINALRLKYCFDETLIELLKKFA